MCGKSRRNGFGFFSGGGSKEATFCATQKAKARIPDLLRLAIKSKMLYLGVMA
jgi:hypothetical protein